MSIRHTNSVRKERTGYRDDILAQRIGTWGRGFMCNDISQNDLDRSISPRHRDWGWDCPATNIDCFMYNYDMQPVALIEFKGRNPISKDRTTANIKASANLANAAKIPLFIVYYDNSKWRFSIDPINDIAIQSLELLSIEKDKEIDEEKFLEFLYDLRGDLHRTNDWADIVTVNPTNIDCFMYEYYYLKPTALIDFKGRSPLITDRSNTNILAASNLADAARIPLFIAYYDSTNWTFEVDPINAIAKQKCFSGKCNELDFVSFLYKMRRSKIPSDVINMIDKSLLGCVET